MQHRNLFISIVTTNKFSPVNITATGSVPYPTELMNIKELAKSAIENINKDQLKRYHLDFDNITILNTMYTSEPYEKS